MKNVVIVLLFMAGFCLPKSAFAQCSNSIELKKYSIANTSQPGGLIELSVTTSKRFTCTLNVEKGSGPEKIQEKKGSGSQTVQFSNLDKTKVYQVVVEFAGEEKFCQKLQKSQITLQ